MAFFKRLKRELFYIRKAFFEHGRGGQYLWGKLVPVRRIFQSTGSLDKPANFKNYSMHILTSHNDLLMMVWALASFYSVSRIFGQMHIHDDGSLTDGDCRKIRELFPNSKLISTKKFLTDYNLEISAFPILYEFRRNYPSYFSFKKIIDPFFVSQSALKLIIDSDVIWYQNPRLLEQQIMTGCPQSWMMKNNGEIVVNFSDGNRLVPELARYNAGIVLFAEKNFSADKFTNYLGRLDTNDRQSLHFADQAGYAYCLNNLQFLPEENYHIKGLVGPATVAKHYTSPRHPQFYWEALPILKSIIFSKS